MLGVTFRSWRTGRLANFRRGMLQNNWEVSSESLREMKKKRQKERQQNHLTTGVVDQLLVVKPHCVSNAIGLIKWRSNQYECTWKIRAHHILIFSVRALQQLNTILLAITMVRITISVGWMVVLIYAAFAMSILSICNVKKPIARVCAHKNDIDGCNSCNKILVIDDSLKI